MKKSNRGQGPDAQPDDQTVADALKRKGGKLEVNPDTNGYELFVNGIKEGYTKVDPTNGRHTFLWTSSSVAWPSKFDLVAPSGSLPSVGSVDVYEHTTFPTTTTSIDVSTCDYRIVQNGSVVGYLRRRTDGLDWYAYPSALSGNYFPTGTMTFESHTDNGTMSLLHVDDKAI